MDKNNVNITKKTGLCCSCGICKNVCPKKCINYIREKGMYVPVIDNDSCIHCGICTEVCPAIHETYEHNEPKQAVIGEVLGSYNAWSKDPEIRHVSASGGCISTIVSELLNKRVYDVAFMVNAYSYEKQLTTVPIIDVTDIKNSTLPKSRYLPVSHENAVSYMIENREKRVILIGTSCALRGLRKVISRFRLNLENYLFLGLFCDKVFNYNVYDYLTDHYSENKTLSSLHFKNKESGGWPGNMKLFFSDGSYDYLDKSIRTELKDYFMPERCLYCIDKLNVSADIAFGDNYTDQNSSKLGSNSVIIRTNQGKQAWDLWLLVLEYEPVSLDKIIKAQYLDGRLLNQYYSYIKTVEIEKKQHLRINNQDDLSYELSPKDYLYSYFELKKVIDIGANYCDNPQKAVKKITDNMKKRGRILRRLKRYYYTIFRNYT
ncbi:Coenzyme F420 hydrogenase/dehydrogenase, beta subunit C-terminal domain [Ruminococcus difficilis]|uniref:Coenzyme F420 hydrogenase/dehydrogenase, beta subunit C-terminal domain n=1 Tax=Ruminococcus difficilis TaxID=2763069 RepID=A0A934U2G4_9FIRM|nr:Coenzyme F420 hydrogenase/dehydrogenase, beta subunit C-terminal domain [Ruminococcus difficilis]MBK6087612.1 Coenzyme F420 hydrogenase/dehydrogenase, beta subunit C-terminal domain [Ruminococcus difficilis]